METIESMKFDNFDIIELPFLSTILKNKIINNKIFNFGELKQVVLDNELYKIEGIEENEISEIVNTVVILSMPNAFELFTVLKNKNLSQLKKQQENEYEAYGKISQGDSQKTKIKKSFITIDESNYNLPVDIFEIFGVKKDVIKKLKNVGIDTLGDLTELKKVEFEQIVTKKNLDSFHKVLRYLKVSLIELTQKVLDEMSGMDRFELLINRAMGRTLNEIGIERNLSRERIRQITKKIEIKLMPFAKEILDLYVKEKVYVTEQELLDIFSKEEYNYVIVYVCKKVKEYDYLSFAEKYIPYEMNGKKIEKKLEEYVKNDTTGDINIESFREYIEEEAPFLEIEDLQMFLRKYKYKIYGDYGIRGKHAYGTLCEKIIARDYQDGINIYNQETLNELTEKVKSEYEDIDIPDNINAKVSAILRTNLILSGRGKYTTKEHIHIDMNLVNTIKNYIDNSTETRIYYMSLFKMFENVLIIKSNVTNYNFLHGILMFYYPQEYNYSRDYFEKKGNTGTTKSLSEEIKNMIIEKQCPIHIDEIRNRYPGISDAVMKNILAETQDFFVWDYNYYSCKEIIKISNEEKQKLLHTIETLLEKQKGYCSEGALYEEIEGKEYNFVAENNTINSKRVFYLCAYLFKEKFDFNKPHISKKGMFHENIMREIAMYMLGDKELVSYREYMKLGEKLKWSKVTTSSSFVKLQKDLIRINEDEYYQKSAFAMEKGVILEIENLLINQMNNDMITLESFDSFEMFPEIGFKWNNFLLHSIIEHYGVQLKIIESTSKYRTTEKGIVVYKNSRFNEYVDIVVECLKQEELYEISREKMLQFLKKKKLTCNGIPNELYNTEKIKFKNEVFIIEGV